MIKLILVSETKPSMVFQLAQAELSKEGLLVSNPVSFEQTIDVLKASKASFVVINAEQRKLEAFELCQKIKHDLKGGVKVFVYLPDASLNEASKFGLLNAEVEDEHSLGNLSSKILINKPRQYLYNETTIAVCGLSGGLGASHIVVLMAYALGLIGQEALLLESTNNFTIKQILQLRSNLALLGHDRSRDSNQVLDADWFNNFVSKTKLLPLTSYLNLFNSPEDRLQYLLQSTKTCQQIIDFAQLAESILIKQQGLTQDFSSSFATKEIKQQLLAIKTSARYLEKDLQGQSLSLFDEIIGLGSTLASTMIFDLGSDLSSSLNRQLLHLSKYLVVVLKDDANVKANYNALRNFVIDQYPCIVVPVLASNSERYLRYKAIDDDSWLDILGEKPLIYPYKPESITRLLFESRALARNDALLNFAKELLHCCRVETDYLLDQKKILNFLVGGNG